MQLRVVTLVFLSGTLGACDQLPFIGGGGPSGRPIADEYEARDSARRLAETVVRDVLLRWDGTSGGGGGGGDECGDLGCEEGGGGGGGGGGAGHVESLRGGSAEVSGTRMHEQGGDSNHVWDTNDVMVTIVFDHYEAGDDSYVISVTGTLTYRRNTRSDQYASGAFSSSDSMYLESADLEWEVRGTGTEDIGDRFRIVAGWSDGPSSLSGTITTDDGRTYSF
jgi:hypothetical protein